MAANPARSPPSPPPSREGLTAGGVLPVLKHLPGHGRASADSHLKLPVVDTDRATLEATDFAAFRPLAGPAARHDRACCVYRHRPGRTGDNFGHNGARSDSRLHRVPRAADERRYLDGRPVRYARRAQPRRARRRLRCRASLQRRLARNDARSRAWRRSLSGEALRARRRGAGCAFGAGGIRLPRPRAKCSRRWSRANCPNTG